MKWPFSNSDTHIEQQIQQMNVAELMDVIERHQNIANSYLYDMDKNSSNEVEYSFAKSAYNKQLKLIEYYKYVLQNKTSS